MKKLLLALALALLPLLAGQAIAQTQQQSESVGVEGTIPTKAPTQAPTITTPTNGQVFNTLPITVAGLCQSNLLIEIFKNGVFSGSVQCTSGSFSLQIDLFSGRNDLVARAYDALNQASPDSNTVTVTYNDTVPPGTSRVSITTAYSKRGAAPGDMLTWPITISGGRAPYAVSVNWGDRSGDDLLTLKAAGNMLLKHIYNQSGIYNITIKVSDSSGASAFLQVVGVGNGPILQTTATTQPPVAAKTDSRQLVIFLIAAIPLLWMAFLLGERHRLQVIRARLRRNLPPF